MKIPVIYADGTPGAVNPEELEGMIQKRRLLTFRRSNGWVRIGIDSLRGISKTCAYNAKERREAK